MRYSSALAAGMLVSAVIIGCGPAKELPDEIPKEKGPEQQVKKKIPTESDPVAKEIVDRAIRVYTQNKSDLLWKGKISKSSGTGTLKMPADTSGQLVEVTTSRVLIAQWPDELKLMLDYSGRLNGSMAMILRRQFTWWGRDGVQNPNLNPVATEDMMRTDGLAQHWLPLLFPLVEPKAVVFEPRKGVGNPPVDLIRFAVPDRPVYQLTFDQSTGFLTRVEYTHMELELQIYKVWNFAEHKSFEGLMLPTRMEYTHAPANTQGDVVQRLRVDKWEFPEKLDANTFDPPK